MPVDRRLPTLAFARASFAAHRDEALDAHALFLSWAPGSMERIVMDEPFRLATYIECGRSVEQAASRLYLYRWSLALQSRVFGAPHLLGA